MADGIKRFYLVSAHINTQKNTKRAITREFTKQLAVYVYIKCEFILLAKKINSRY